MKTLKKSSSKKIAATSASAAPLTTATQDPGATAPTGEVVPKAPTDWKPVKIGRGKGARAKGVQVSNAVVAGKEIASSATYAEDFGPHAPSQARLAHLISGAAAWRAQWVAAKRWTAYVASQNASWWDAALDATNLLQPAFDYAVARDPDVAGKYPSTTQFMQAGTVIAKRAATSRKARAGANGAASAKAKGAAAAAPVTEAAPAVAAAEPEGVVAQAAK